MDRGDAKDVKPRGDILVMSRRHLARKKSMASAHERRVPKVRIRGDMQSQVKMKY